MSNPTISASLNKTTYADGELMTLTVTYGDPDRETLQISVKVTDSSGNSATAPTVTAVIDPLTIDFLEDADRTWTKVSDSGTVAVYTATA